MVELKAEKQRSQQQQPAGDSKPDAKQAATGVKGWIQSHKAVSGVAVVAALAVCIQACGILDVKATAAQLLAPVLNPLWKVGPVSHVLAMFAAFPATV